MNLVKQIDELTREEFDFYQTNNVLILDSYRYSTRENTRKRSYTPIKRYERLSHRSSNITLQEVPLTEEVKKQVLEEYFKTLKVMTWEEYKK